MLKTLAATLLLLCAGAFAQPGPGVEWKQFDAGMAAAMKEGKYGFISVYTDWCGYCRMLDQKTLRDNAVVKELKKNFVSVKLNAESESQVSWKGSKQSMRQLAGKWGVSGFPTLLFLNSKGEIIGSYPSYAEPDMMLKLLTYISSGARERNETFEDFIKKAS